MFTGTIKEIMPAALGKALVMRKAGVREEALLLPRSPSGVGGALNSIEEKLGGRDNNDDKHNEIVIEIEQMTLRWEILLGEIKKPLQGSRRSAVLLARVEHNI